MMIVCCLFVVLIVYLFIVVAHLQLFLGVLYADLGFNHFVNCMK
jgi:hypothetical protein